VSPCRAEPLFDPASVEPKKCSCGTTRKNLCKWAADKHLYGIDARQPKTCLLRYDPSTAAIPY
jgi:hypothetical protein